MDAPESYTEGEAQEEAKSAVIEQALGDETTQKLIEQQKEIAARLDFDAFLKADEEFHLFIYHRYDNPGMKQVVVRYKDKMYRSRYKSVSIPGRVELSIAQHQSMLDLLHAKRADETIRLLEEHLSRHERMMLSGTDRPNVEL